MNDSKEDIVKFNRYLKLRYSPSTIKQYMSALVSYSNLLNSQDELDQFLIDKGDNPFYRGFIKSYIECYKLPFDIVKSKKKGQGLKKQHKFLTKNQIDDIIDNSNEWISLMVRLYFETGLRLRELIETDKDDINIVERTIEGMGKGNKPFKVRFSPTSAALIQKYFDGEQFHKLKAKPFHLSLEDKDHARSFYYYLKKQCDALGIPNVHPHRIRHALGHYLRVDKGWDLQQIKVKLRHTKLETTEIYTEATQKEVDDKMDEEVFENK